MKQIEHNPDVLNCLANLSNDEVFTPPALANQMLDLLPQELFKDPNTTFLDPFCKTGVFLREIVKRLDKGLEDVIPDRQERIDHILHKQVFGMAITELTSLLTRRTLYCSKFANGEHSISHFDTLEGNVWYKPLEHTWHYPTRKPNEKDEDYYKRVRCKHCGAPYEIYGRSNEAEQYAYPFIHLTDLKSIYNMKFSVICGNPPYQIKVGVTQENFAISIYHLFVEQAIKLSPDYISMIIPARWYSGGRGLDNFRKEMLADSRIRRLIDYPNFKECFSSGADIPGGVCYFLWDKSYKGDCAISNVIGGNYNTMSRPLNEFDVLIRYNTTIELVKRLHSLNINSGKTLAQKVSVQTPFGILTSYKPENSGIPCWFKQRTGLMYVNPKDITDDYSLMNRWKLLIPEAPIAGQTDFTKKLGIYYEGNTRIAKPGEICSQTYLVGYYADTKEEIESFRTYLFTKTVRFLLSQRVISQHIPRQSFAFVPDLGHYSGKYSDEFLIKEWGITDEEWQLIDERIKDVSEINSDD